MFKRTDKAEKKPELHVVPLHPEEKPQITCLGTRLEQVIYDYCEQENKAGRMVTIAEIVGTVDMVKDTIKGQQWTR